MARHKYRHRVTGYVKEYEDSYAAAVDALELVDDDTPESVPYCGC